jgi:hypothetical protein
MVMLVSVFAVTIFAALNTAIAEDTMKMKLFPPDKIEWVAGPASLPKGVKIALLEGDPNKTGPYVLRLKAPDGYRIPAHTHPKTERLTILQGTLHVGTGKKFARNETEPMPAGAYGYMPANMAHFVWTQGETILQLHGEGPWMIHYVNPADDPRNAHNDNDES